jgi:hypothetical protein
MIPSNQGDRSRLLAWVTRSFAAFDHAGGGADLITYRDEVTQLGMLGEHGEVHGYVGLDDGG